MLVFLQCIGEDARAADSLLGPLETQWKVSYQTSTTVENFGQLEVYPIYFH